MSIQLPISKDFDVVCPKCEEIAVEELEEVEEVSVTVLIQDIEYASSDERGMGTETQYDFVSDVQCPNCKHEWEVKGEVWEYPEGAINLIQLTK